MSSRDHPFNKSTRPLLERKQQPQLLLKKKYDYKVCGFNDFNFVSKQCNNDLSKTYYSGYPYGSPPSPTVATGAVAQTAATTTHTTSADFIFSDDSGIHLSNTSNLSASSANFYNSTSDDSYRPPPLHKQSSVAATRGPFIFGVDTTNKTISERYRPLPAPPRHRASDGGSVIQTNNKTQYSNETAQPQCETNVKTQCVPSDKRLLKKSRRRLKKSENENKENLQGIKCVLVGDGAVGKTNLICSYVDNRFISEHIPTASDTYNFEVKVNEMPVQVTLCDTAGQDSLDPLRQLSYPDSDIFLLCFSVVKPESFSSIKMKWVPQFAKSSALILLIGTQADLRSDPSILSRLQKNGKSPVAMADAWDLATLIGAKYIETSSLMRVGVKDAFDTAIWDALVSLNLSQTPPFWKKLFCLA